MGAGKSKQPRGSSGAAVQASTQSNGSKVNDSPPLKPVVQVSGEAAKPSTQSKDEGGGEGAHHQEAAQQSKAADPHSIQQRRFQSGRVHQTVPGSTAAHTKQWLAPSASTILNPNLKHSASVSQANLARQQKDRAAAVAALESEVDSTVSPQDNAKRLLNAYMIEHSTVLTPTDKAKLDYVMRTLDVGVEAVVPKGLLEATENMDSEDAEVTQWLRADFTPNKPKNRVGDVRQRMKAVGLGVMAGKNLIRMVKSGLQNLPNLPFECESLEEEAAILESLQGLGNWEWDIWQLREVSKGRELQVLGWHVLLRWELIQTFNLDQHVVRNFLRFVEESYTDTEYHNYVLHGVFFMLTTARAEKFLSEIEIFALLVATMAHDLGHDGLNNNFHKNALTDRALAHNDQSIQENYHSQTVFSMMIANPEINILANFANNQYVEIRRMVISIILATDMSKHFIFLKDFKQLIETKGPKPEDWTDATDHVMHAVMHICDISNPARPKRFAIEWAERCLKEFFKQGEREKELGLPISPQCNPETTSMPASQIGFIKFIVLPTYQMLGTLLPEVEQICVKQLNENLEFWQEEMAKLKTDDPTAKKIPERSPSASSPSHKRGDSMSLSQKGSSMSLSQDKKDEKKEASMDKKDASMDKKEAVTGSKPNDGSDSKAAPVDTLKEDGMEAAGDQPHTALPVVSEDENEKEDGSAKAQESAIAVFPANGDSEKKA